MVDNQSTEEAVKMDTAKKEISDAVDYYRWDEEDKSIALDSIDKNPEIFKALVEAKNHEGKPLFSAEGIAEIFFSWKDTIENHPDKIKAVLSNPDECYGKYTSSDVRVFMDSVEHPRFSTIVQNPEVFIYTKSQITEGTLFYIQDFLDYKYGRPNSEIRDVINMVDKNPEIFKTLTEAKDNEGKLLFNENDLRYYNLYQFRSLMTFCIEDATNLNKVKIVLSNPDEIDKISRSPQEKFETLFDAAYNPTASTININPRAFGYGPFTKEELISAINEQNARDFKKYGESFYSETVIADMMDKHPDMVKILTEAKDKNGKPLFDALAMGKMLSDKDKIENHPNIITSILNNPDEINWISDSQDRGSAFSDAVRHTLLNIWKLADLREKMAKNGNMSRDDIEYEYERINPELAALREEEKNKIKAGMNPKQANKERRLAVKDYYNKKTSREE